MVDNEALSDLLETFLGDAVNNYSISAHCKASISSDQAKQIGMELPLDILQDLLGGANTAASRPSFLEIINPSLFLALLVIASHGGISIPLENGLVATQILAHCLTLSPNVLDAILCTLMNAVSLSLSFLEHASSRAKSQRKSYLHKPQSQASSRRESQSIANSQSSVGTQDEYDLLADTAEEGAGTNAAPATAFATVLSAFGTVASYFTAGNTDIQMPAPDTISYLRATIAETISRLLNRPIKHLDIEGNHMMLITAAIHALKAMLETLEPYRGTFTYDIVRLLMLNPAGKYKVVSTQATELINLVQSLCHDLLCQSINLAAPSKDSVTKIQVESQTIDKIIPIVQFGLLSAHDLSAVRTSGITALSNLLAAVLKALREQQVASIEGIFTKIFFTLQGLANQPKTVFKLTVIDFVTAMYTSKDLCAAIVAHPHILEQLCLDVLFPLVCDQEDSVAAAAVNLLTHIHSDKVITNFITLLLYPLTLTFTLSCRTNIKCSLVIQSVTLRKATTGFLGACILNNTSKLLDVVIPCLERAGKGPLSSPSSSSESDNERDTTADDPLSLSMLDDTNETCSLTDAQHAMLNFIRDTISVRGQRLLLNARKQLQATLQSTQTSATELSISDFLLDELSVRCQDVSPAVRKLAISTMLDCANVMPLSLWFECVFTLNGDSTDTSVHNILDHVHSILLQPILGCIEYVKTAQNTRQYKVSPLFGGVLFHLAAKYEGSEQRVTITSLSYTIRDTLRLYNVCTYLERLDRSIKIADQLSPKQQIVGGALTTAVGCALLLIQCLKDGVALDDTVASCPQFSHIASLAATGSIGPSMLATIRNPVLSMNFTADTIGVGISYLFLTCVSLLSDCLLGEGRQWKHQVMMALQFDIVADVLIQSLDDILHTLVHTDTHHAETVSTVRTFSDGSVLIFRNLLEGIACIVQLYATSDDIAAERKCINFLKRVNPVLEYSTSVLYAALPSALEHMAARTSNKVACATKSILAARTSSAPFYISKNYVEAAVGHAYCLLRILQVHNSLPATYRSALSATVLPELQSLLAYIQTTVTAQLQQTIVCISDAMTGPLVNLISNLQANTQSTLPLIIEHLTRALALSPSALERAYNNMPSEFQIMTYILRDLVSEGLTEPPGQGQATASNPLMHTHTSVNDLLFSTSMLLNEFLTCCLDVIKPMWATEKESESIRHTSQLIWLYEDLLGVIISCIGYISLRMNPLTEENALLTHVSYLSQVAVTFSSSSARSNALLSLLSLCYIAPDTLGDYILLLLALGHGYSLLIRRQVLLVASDLLMKEYIRREPAVLLTIYALVAREDNLELLLFARRVFFEPLLQKTPNAIVHSFLDLILLFTDCRHLERDSLKMIERRIGNTIQYSALEGGKTGQAAAKQVSLYDRLQQSLVIPSARQRNAFYMYLLGFSGPPKRFEMLSIILIELMDKIHTASDLVALHDAVYDIVQLLVTGIFDYKVEALTQQLPEAQTTQDDAMTSEKVTVLSSIIMRLTGKYSLERLLPTLLRLYSLSRECKLELAIHISRAIHSILKRSKLSLSDLKESSPQFGAELLELTLLLKSADAKL